MIWVHFHAEAGIFIFATIFVSRAVYPGIKRPNINSQIHLYHMSRLGKGTAIPVGL
jgi:hypothetical protein